MVDPRFGEQYGHSYVTPDGDEVWMWRKGQRVRFFTADGVQVGSEHKNVAPAVVWAAYHGWIDPTDVMLSVAVIREVRANTTFRRKKAVVSRV